MTINADALDNIKPESIQEIPRALLRIQQEVPYDPDHTTISITSQGIKLMFNEILPFDFDATQFGKDSMTGRELKELHDDLYKKSFDIHYHGFLMKTGASLDPQSGTYVYKNLEKLQHILLDHAVQNDLDTNELDGLLLTQDKEEFEVPLAFSTDPGSFEKLLNSLISDIIRQQMSGRSFIMATEQGFKPTQKDQKEVDYGKAIKQIIDNRSRLTPEEYENSRILNYKFYLDEVSDGNAIEDYNKGEHYPSDADLNVTSLYLYNKRFDELSNTYQKNKAISKASSIIHKLEVDLTDEELKGILPNQYKDYKKELESFMINSEYIVNYFKGDLFKAAEDNPTKEISKSKEEIYHEEDLEKGKKEIYSKALEALEKIIGEETNEVTKKILEQHYIDLKKESKDKSKIEIKNNDWLNYNRTNVVWVKGKYNLKDGLMPQKPGEGNKILPGQCAITWNFKDRSGNRLSLKDFIIEEDGHKFLDMSKIDEEILKMIGNRIPTQGHPSMADMEVVAFVDPIMGDVVVSSQDLTTIMGADFDIDKLYAYMYNYFYGMEDEDREAHRDIESEMSAMLGDIKELNKQFPEWAKFLTDLKNKKANKYSMEAGSEFHDYMTNSIARKNQELNEKYDYGMSVPEVIQFFDNLTPDEVKAINEHTYSSKFRSKVKKGEVVVAPSLDELYSGEDLVLAKIVKNHIGFYNASFKQSIEQDDKTAQEYIGLVAEKIGKDKEYKKLQSEVTGFNSKYKLMKLKTDFENPENNTIEQLHNGMQDIYHTILSNKNVWEKVLQGITEGNLAELSDHMKMLKPKADTELPSPASDRYKTEEYMSNRASKLGVGIFSLANTFLSIIEEKGLYLSKVIDKSVVQDPLVIRDSQGRDHEFSELSGSKGHNKLASIFQSASVDDPKLKILSALNINKYTMGITGLMCGLANDSLMDGARPVLSTDYIVNFLCQPIVSEYLNQLSTANDTLTTETLEKQWKDNVKNDLRIQYGENLSDTEIANLEPVSLEDLLHVLEHEKALKEDESATDPDSTKKYNQIQLYVFQQFLKLEEAAETIRKAQYVTNTDSKGASASIQEALFKQSLYEQLSTEGAPNVGNLENLFFKDNGEKTLQGYLAGLGIDTPISLFRGTEETGPILPFASDAYTQFLDELKTLQGGKQQDSSFFNGKLANEVWTAFLAYNLSHPSLEFTSVPMDIERTWLLRDSDTNKSLATLIGEFKDSPLYLNNPLLKPLFNSISIKSGKDNPNFKFIDFRGSVGLTVQKSDITKALFMLSQLNYPLYEKLLKYAFLVSPPGSPTSLRKYFPNIYLQATGVTDNMRKLNRSWNVDPETQPTNIDISINPYLPPVRPIHQMFFQHRPERAFRFDSEMVSYGNPSKREIFFVDSEHNSDFYYTPEGSKFRVPVSFAGTFNKNNKNWELYKLIEFNPKGDSKYVRIPLLGTYNLSEYNARHTDQEPMESILPVNNIGFRYEVPNSFQVIDQHLPESMDQLMGHSGAAYGGDHIFHSILKPLGVDVTHYRPEDNDLPKIFKDSMSEKDKARLVKKADPKDLEEGFKMLERIRRREYNKKDRESYGNKLAARDYIQVRNSDAVYALAPLSSPTTVKGGTGIAVEMAKLLHKPVFVWDTKSEKWHRWNGNRFEELKDENGNDIVPYLTKNFAAIGTRTLEHYKKPSKDKPGEFEYNEDYLGAEKEAAAKQAVRDVFQRTQAVVEGTVPKETEKVPPIEPQKTVAVTANVPKSINTVHLTNKYGYDPTKSDPENVRNILINIAKSSTNDSYRILATIMSQVAEVQKTLGSVKFELGNANEYENGTIRINAQGKPEDFAKMFQFNFLHEAVHHFLGEKLDDGSEVSVILSKAIENLISVLESPENLLYASHKFNLGLSIPEIQERLRLFREQAHTSESTGTTIQYSSEAERGVLNPLINKHEFVASLLGDPVTQQWTADINYEGESKQSVTDKFLDILKGLFNNFLKSLGVKISGKDNTVLKEGIRLITQAFARKPKGSPEAKLEDLRPDKDDYVEHNGYDPAKLGKSPLRWMPKKAKFRADVEATTLVGAIIEGKRTTSTRTKSQINRIEELVGGINKDGTPKGNPYIWTKDDNGIDDRTILLKVKKIYRQPNGERKLTPEQWSETEGWDPSYAIEKPEELSNKMWQFEFEYVKPEVIQQPTNIKSKEKGPSGPQLGLFASMKSVEDEAPIDEAPESLSEEEARKEREIRLSVRQKLKDTSNDLSRQMSSINKNGRLADDTKKARIGQLLKRRAALEADIRKIDEGLELSDYVAMANKQLSTAEDLMNQTDLDSDKIGEIQNILGTHITEYHDRLAEYTAESPTEEPEMTPWIVAMEKIAQKATGLRVILNNISLQNLTKIGIDATGYPFKYGDLSTLKQSPAFFC